MTDTTYNSYMHMNESQVHDALDAFKVVEKCKDMTEEQFQRYLVTRSIYEAIANARPIMPTDCKYYHITLTAHPDDPTPDPDLRRAISGIISSTMWQTIAYYASLETTEVGTPHVHMLLQIGPNSKRVPSPYFLKRINRHGPQKIARNVCVQLIKDPCSPVNGLKQVIDYIEKPDAIYTTKPYFGNKEPFNLLPHVHL